MKLRNAKTPSSVLRTGLALLALSLMSGCQTLRLTDLTLKYEFMQFPYFFEEKLDVTHYNHWADEAWLAAQAECPSGMVYSEYYAKGFRDGFVDFCFGGGSGKPPLVPPRPFWKLAYRQENAADFIRQWQAGYEHGAQVARDGGYRHQAILPALRAAGFGADEFAGPLDSPLPHRHHGPIDTEHTSSRRARGLRNNETPTPYGTYGEEQSRMEALPEQLPAPAMPLTAPRKGPTPISPPAHSLPEPRSANPFRNETAAPTTPDDELLPEDLFEQEATPPGPRREPSPAGQPDEEFNPEDLDPEVDPQLETQRRRQRARATPAVGSAPSVRVGQARYSVPTSAQRGPLTTIGEGMRQAHVTEHNFSQPSLLHPGIATGAPVERLPATPRARPKPKPQPKQSRTAMESAALFDHGPWSGEWGADGGARGAENVGYASSVSSASEKATTKPVAGKEDPFAVIFDQLGNSP